MREYELPYPPSVNHYWRRVGRRTLISREGRAFRAKVCSALRAVGVRPMLGPIEVQVELYPPDRRRRDIDNPMKSLLGCVRERRCLRGRRPDRALDGADCASRSQGGRCIVRIKEAV